MGNVLQYGVWTYKDKKVTWSFKVDTYVMHEINDLISSDTNTFKLKEVDGSTTTFSKIADLHN